MGLFDASSRARNKSELPWVGDPERWGGSDMVIATADPAGGGPPSYTGKQLIRAQTRDLVAVGWDLLCTWTAAGFNAVTDTITVGLLVTIGAGQATSEIFWDCGTLSPAGNVPNPQAVALGWRPFNFSAAAFVGNGGVAISGQPVIACNLNAFPLVFVSTAGVLHTLQVSINAHCAPRAWAP